LITDILITEFEYPTLEISKSYIGNYPEIIPSTLLDEPIAVAARSMARIVFARSNTEIVGSNPTGDMDVYMFSVCVYSVSTPFGGG
jgi:hypothetical protein